MVGEMCNLLKHGGPDDEGYYTCAEQHLVLGHRRLALIDLSPGGHQPMSYADDRYWIFTGRRSDFLYLTGSEEAGSVLVLAPGGIQIDGRTVREVLFVPPRNPSDSTRRSSTRRGARPRSPTRSARAWGPSAM